LAFFNLVKNTIDPGVENPYSTPMLRKLFRPAKITHWTILEAETGSVWELVACGTYRAVLLPVACQSASMVAAAIHRWIYCVLLSIRLSFRDSGLFINQVDPNVA
jgi:hypothetical protein